MKLVHMALKEWRYNMQDLLDDVEKIEEVLSLLNKGETVAAQVKLVKMACAKEMEFERLETQMEQEAA